MRLTAHAGFGGRLHGKGPGSYIVNTGPRRAAHPTGRGPDRPPDPARTHVLIRLKSDIPLKEDLADPGGRLLLAELSGDGVTVAVRVIEYYADVEGQEVPEMFCLVTDLTTSPGTPPRTWPRSISGGGTGRRPRSARPRRPERRRPGTGPMLARAPRAWSGRNSPPGRPPSR